MIHAQISSAGTALENSIFVGPFKGYVVDVPGKRYATFDSRSKFENELHTAAVNGNKLVDDAAMYALTLGASIYTPANFELSENAPPGSKTSQVTVETLRGKPVYRIVQSAVHGQSGMRIDTYLDKATFAPAELTETTIKGATSLVVLQLSFSSFTLSPTAADAAQFAYTPGADETAYTAPASESGEAPLLADGHVAPDFSVLTADGKTVKLSDYAGKVVVLDFWATWCEPCQMSLPLTDTRWQHAFAAKGRRFSTDLLVGH